jgi:hypothetical protein
MVLFYNHQNVEEEIFWKYYSDLEKKKVNSENPDNLEKSEIDVTLSLNSLSQWLCRKLKSCISPKFILSLKLSKEEEKSFRLFFIDKSKNLATSLLTFNTVSLIVMLVILWIDEYTTHSFEGSSAILSLKVAATSTIAVWLLFSIMCLIYFCIFIMKYTVVLKYLKIDLHEQWINLSYFILFGRIYCFLSSLTSDMLDQSTCIGIYMMEDRSYALWYLIINTILNYSQTFVFCAMPFPWQWSLLLTTLHCLQSLLQLYSCQELLPVDSNARMKVVNGFAIGTLTYYFIIISIISYSYERSVKSSYQNRQHQSRLANETKKFVDLLCTDVKVTMQQVGSIFGDIELSTPQSMMFTKLVPQIKETSDIVTDIVDDLLFLAKFGEGRFTLKHEQRKDLRTCVKESVDSFITAAIQLYRTPVTVEIDVKNESISTDLKCLNFLIFYGLIAMLNPSCNQQNSSSSLEQKKEERQDFKVSCQRDSPINKLEPDKLTFEIQRTNNENTMDEIGSEIFQSVGMICSRLVISYNGRFFVKDSKLVFTLPAGKLTEDQLTNRTENPRTSNNDKLAEFLQTKVCLYLTENNVEELFMETVHRLYNNIQWSIVRGLNILDLQLRELVFVQSVEAGQELRHKGYQGSIILFSEKLSYLDLDGIDTQLFDYVMSLPPRQSDFKRIKLFILAKSESESVLNQRTRLLESDNLPELSFPKMKKNLIFTMISIFGTFGTIPIDPYRMLSYSKWRFLNPGEYIFHHTANITVFGIVMCIYYSFQYSLGLLNTIYFLVVMIVCTVFMFKGHIRNALAICFPIDFMDLWTAGSFLVVTASAVQFFSEFTGAIVGRVFHTWSRPETFDEFLEQGSGLRYYSGFETLFFLLNMPQTMKFFSEFFPWPVPYLMMITLIIRSFVIIVCFLEPFMNEFELYFTIFSFGCYGIVMLRVQFDVEKLYRQEFTGLFNLIMSRHYNEQCLKLVRELRYPLQTLVKYERGALDLIIDASVANQFIIPFSFIPLIGKLQQNSLILQELVLSIQLTNEDVFSKVNKEDLITRMKTVLLRPLINQVCQKFVDETNVPIYFRLAPELTFLRVDCELFIAILSKVIRFALKRIDLDVTRQLRHRRTNDNHHHHDRESKRNHQSSQPKYKQQQHKSSSVTAGNSTLESEMDNTVDDVEGKEFSMIYSGTRLFRLAKDMLMNIVDAIFENHRNDEEENEIDRDDENQQQQPVDDEEEKELVKSSGNDLIDDCFQNDPSIPKSKQQKPWPIKHQILIWFTAADPCEGKEYAFKDVRGMQIMVLDTSRYPDSFNNCHAQQYFHFYESPPTSLLEQDSRLPTIPTEQQQQHHLQQEMNIAAGTAFTSSGIGDNNLGVRGENRNEDGEPLSDRFIDFFQITSRTSCAYQYGSLMHAQYKSFQRITLPFKLSVDSNRWQNMFPADINRIYKIQTTSKSYYPTYFSYVVNDIPDLLKEQFFYGSHSAFQIIEEQNRYQKHEQKLNTRSTSASNRHQKSSSNHVKISSKTASSNISKPAKSILLKKPHRPIQDIEGGKDFSNYTTAAAGNDLSGNTTTINRTTWDGQISIYCKPNSELNQSILRFQSFFSQYGWITRPHHPKPLPSLSSYQNIDCVIIEYLDPTIVSSKSAFPSHESPSPTNASKSGYNVQDIIHILRGDGFVGVIILAFSSGLSSENSTGSVPTDQDWWDQYILESQEIAILPDAFFTLPLTHDILIRIMGLCAKRLVQLSISAYSPYTNQYINSELLESKLVENLNIDRSA